MIDQAPQTLSGTLLSRDGTKLRFSRDGYVSQIEDRNGNQIVISWQGTASGGIFSFSDPLGRTESINYTEDVNTDTQDVITYPGYNNASRTIKVNYSSLQAAATEPLQTYHCLFPELNGASSSTQFNPWVISSIQLADGSQYSMKYNAYGELAQLALPTGGVYKYSYWEAGCSTNGGASGVITLDNNSGYRIMRPLRERDEYADGVNLSAKQVFTYPTGVPRDANHDARTVSETVIDFEDAASNILRKEMHYFYGKAAATDAPPADPATFANWWEGLEYLTYISDRNYSVKQQVQRVYQQRPCAQGESCPMDPQSEAAPSHDPQLCQTNTIFDNAASSVLYAYDQFDNIVDNWEYDYGSAPAIGPSCASAPGNYLRHTNTQYVAGGYTDRSVNMLGLPALVSVFGPGGTLAAQTHYGYDETSVAGAPNIIGHDNVNYAGGGLRGNLTNPAQCLNPPACTTWVNHAMVYDIAGNVVSAADGNNHVTRFSYNDDGQNRYAFVTGTVDALGHTTAASYDYAIGKPVTTVGRNAAPTTYQYNDALDRLTTVTRTEIAGGTSYTTIAYNGTNQVTRYDQQTANWNMPAETDYDGLGRPTATKAYEDPSHAITTTTDYDALGRVYHVSNPRRGGDAVSLTTYNYDVLGRMTSSVTPDGAASSSTYYGQTTTVTDPAGKVKKYVYDALGRLVTVFEDPNGLNYATNYGYDALGDMIWVSQGYCPNCQGRSFGYDALQRLTSASNGESGTVSYRYDNAGNLTDRTDARNVATHYSYDLLNRITAQSYSDGTPTVNYTYDNPNDYGMGLLSQVSNGVSTTTISFYDPQGRVTSSQQTTGGQTYNFSYTYNLAGALTAETLPSGRVVATSYNTLNQPASVSGTINGTTKNYVAAATYAAHGAPAQVWLGNTLVDNYTYNNRLQPASVSTSVNNNSSNTFVGYSLNWGTTNNNGNLQSVDEYNGGLPLYPTQLHFNQSYLYDGVNRLTYALDTSSNCSPASNYACWFRGYQYDAWGNMWVPSGSNGGVPQTTATPNSNVYTMNNQMQATSYDAAGNQLAIGATALTYDAEGRQTSATNPPVAGGGTATYRYDGQGRRVQKAMGSGVTTYVYDIFGKLAAEYTNFPSPVPACSTCYLTRDHLGSLRMVTDQGANLISRHDYLPFGEEIAAGTAGRDNYFARQEYVKSFFTGQERDAETGLDFFQARYMSAAQGRFLSADPFNAGADPANPQSWNAYAYVNNNPLTNIDPTGTCSIGPDGVAHDDEPGDCGGGSVNVPGGPPEPVPIDPCFFCGYIPGNPGGGVPPPEQTSPPGNSVTSQPASGNPPKNGTCPAVPPHPLNASLVANASEAKKLRWLLPPLKESVFYLDVRNGSQWDYKQQGRTLGDFGTIGPSPYQDFGNFNFGVVGAAAGFPAQELLRGAGYAQERAGTSSPEWGHWYSPNAPYGDDPSDQAMIRAGIAYYQNGCVK